MLVSSNVSPDALADRGRIVDDFRELGARAAARGLRVAFEALAWARHISDHRDAWEIVRQVNHPAVGLALDAFSSLAPGIPIDSLSAIDPKALPRADRRCSETRHGSAVVEPSFSLHARTGRPAAGRICRCAEAASVTTACCRWRSSTTVFARDRPPRSRSMACVRSTICWSRWSALHADAHPRTACKGVEFIEFCASEEEAQQLGQMLRTLGFVPTHRHVRKAVTRWRQGDINLVVNCEPDGFAHSYDTVHGASVCAIGLRVADPDGGAVARASVAGPELFATCRSRRIRNPGAARCRRQSALLHEGVRNAVDLANRVRGAAARPLVRSTRASSASITFRRACSTRRCSPGCCTT